MNSTSYKMRDDAPNGMWTIVIVDNLYDWFLGETVDWKARLMISGALGELNE